MKEQRCKRCGCLIPEECILCSRCGDYNEMQTFERRIVTNGDRIRAMDNDELAAFLDDLTLCCAEVSCESCPIGCKRDERTGKPFCGSDNIEKWVKRRV